MSFGVGSTANFERTHLPRGACPVTTAHLTSGEHMHHRPEIRLAARHTGSVTGRGHWRPAVAVAAGLAFASAAVTAYWTFGGTALLDTVGGYPEELARAHDLPAVLVGLLVIAMKSVGGLVALALAVPPDGRIPRRLVVLAGGVGSALLIAYGGLLTAAGALVLTGVLKPEGSVDRRGSPGTSCSGTRGSCCGASPWP
jgi:hypothetical protein